MPRAKKTVSLKDSSEKIAEPLETLVKQIDLEEVKPKQVPVKIKIVSDDLSIRLKKNITDLSGELSSVVENMYTELLGISNSLNKLSEFKLSQEEVAKRDHDVILKNRKREEEEYEYQLRKKRQIENDLWVAEKEKRELVLSQKETELRKAEDELKDLRAKDKTFDAQVAKAVNGAVEDIRKRLTQEYTHKEALTASQYESQKLLLEAKVDDLSKLVVLYQTEIERLNHQVDSANARLTEIASGAVRSMKSGQVGGKGTETD